MVSKAFMVHKDLKLQNSLLKKNNNYQNFISCENLSQGQFLNKKGSIFNFEIKKNKIINL